tara:strand:- start:200 stop:823 length:624 start_codon:yes stop_codon:yes gene_type:complete
MNKIGEFGKIYKLTSLDPLIDSVYIGSTSSKYFSVRLCQHAEAFRNGKDYFGIFNENGKCNSEILDIVSKNNEDYVDLLRKLERYHLNENDNCINIRKPCYYNEQERKDSRKKFVKKYQQSPKGQVAMQISVVNYKIKELNKKLEEVSVEWNQYLHEEAVSTEPVSIQDKLRKESIRSKIKTNELKFELLKEQRNDLLTASLLLRNE